MHYFVLMGTKFRNYWTSIRTGDRIIQEHYEGHWIPVFFILKKTKLRQYWIVIYRKDL